MKDDIRRVNEVAKKFGLTPIQRHEFGDLIHAHKKSGNYGSGKNGDFTYDELEQLARDFVAEQSKDDSEKGDS